MISWLIVNVFYLSLESAFHLFLKINNILGCKKVARMGFCNNIWLNIIMVTSV